MNRTVNPIVWCRPVTNLLGLLGRGANREMEAAHGLMTIPGGSVSESWEIGR
jgi:hypothetical protein